jgi:predicted dehydrogenase
MSPLNVALVGFGYAGQTFHAPLIRATPGLRLHSIVSRGDLAAAAHPDALILPDLDAALSAPEVDLVVIATPNALHAPQAIAALEAGKAVVVDKPFALNLAQAEQVLATAARTGRQVFVFHNRRWDGDFLTLKALLEAGSLGRLASLESRFDRFRPTVRDRWRETGPVGGGLWMDLGPHLLDQALQLFGSPLALQADIAALRERAVNDDYFQVILCYPHHRVVLGASMLAADADLRFLAQGDKAAWRKHGLDVQEEQLKAGLQPGGPGWGADGAVSRLTLGADQTRSPIPLKAGNYADYYAAVRDAVLGKGPNPTSGDQMRLLMRLMELAQASSQSGSRLTV